MPPYKVAYKPETSTQSEKQIVLACIQKAAAELQSMPDNETTQQARKRLMWGSVKRSRVDGVNSLPTLLKFVSELAEPTLIILRPGTENPLLKFEVIPPWKAVTSLVRMKDLELETKGRAYPMDVHPCIIRKKGDTGILWEHRLHAPKISPIPTEAVTFVLTPGWDNLVEWFAGEDTKLWEPNGDLGSQWVWLGVDLVAENIRKNKKTYGHPRPFVSTPRAGFTPSAPPVPNTDRQTVSV